MSGNTDAGEDLCAAEAHIAALTDAIGGLLEQAPLGIPDDRRAMDEARAAAHAAIDTPYCRPSCRAVDGRLHPPCGCPCGHPDLTTNQENNQ